MTSLRLIFLLFPCCDRSCLLHRLARRLCWRMVEQRLVPSRPYRFLAWFFVVVRRLRQHTYSSRRLSLGELSLLCERPCVAHCYTGSLPCARRMCSRSVPSSYVLHALLRAFRYSSLALCHVLWLFPAAVYPAAALSLWLSFATSSSLFFRSSPVASPSCRSDVPPPFRAACCSTVLGRASPC